MLYELGKSFQFEITKFLYYRRCSLNRINNYENINLKELIDNGLVILENVISSRLVENIRSEIQPSLLDVADGKFSGRNKYYRFDDYGVYRLLDIDVLSPTSKYFFEHETINQLASAYVSTNVKSYQRMAEIKQTIGRTSISDNWHFDDWRHRFKAFLYLTDVTSEQAPFVYLKGSHNPKAPWRKRKEREYYIYGKERGSYGYLTPDEVSYIEKKFKYERFTCAGKAGTVIITDTRGVHKGTPLRSGQRVLLANYFGLRD